MAQQIQFGEVTLDAGTSPVNIDIKEIGVNEYNFFGAATLSQNKEITADLAAPVRFFPGSDTPSFLWDGVRIIINWFAVIDLGGFEFNVLGRVLSQREAQSRLRITATYVQSEGGFKVQVELIDEDRTYYSVTYTEAAALVGTGSLKPGSVYIISETGMPNNDGEIQLVAVTSNKFSIKGSHSFSKPSAGAIRFIGGAVGSSINTINVDGNNILTGVIGWNTDIETTVADAVSNIVANSGVSGFSAVQVGNNNILLSSVDSGNAHNAEAVGATVTAGVGSLAIDFTIDMQQGLDLYDLWTDIDYDFPNDIIYSVSDKAGNKFVPAVFPSSNYKSAPWGVANITGNKMIGIASSIGMLGISGSIRDNIFQNTAGGVATFSGEMSNNQFIGVNLAIYDCGGDVKGGIYKNTTLSFRGPGIGDDVNNNYVANIPELKIESAGISVEDCEIKGKATWAPIEITTSLSEKVINTIESNLQVSKAITANAISLLDDVGAGVIETSNTGTLNTINNTLSVPDTIIIKPAAATTLTLDPGSATNILVSSASPVILVGNNEDFCILIRNVTNTAWLMQSYSNF